MKKILVIGANGQLGSCIKKISSEYKGEFEFDFTDSQEVDITDKEFVLKYFKNNQPEYCINASAYTAVDLAESEPEKAFSINADGVANLAEACKENNATLIHISTDYVFDGETETSYSEDDSTNPLGIYGESKRKGEEYALQINPKTIVIRTSWLYSEFNKNFVKTMLGLFKTKDEIGVVADQFGQPTNANDLAKAIMHIIQFESKTYGVFHFSNFPETNWFEFAKKIAQISKSEILIKPISTSQYPTPAKRPQKSTMNLDKIQKEYNIKPINWEESLENCIDILESNP